MIMIPLQEIFYQLAAFIQVFSLILVPAACVRAPDTDLGKK